MKNTQFFVSGTCADCLAFFKENHVILSFKTIVNLLTKAAVYNLYLSETYDEAKRLGECIYQFKVPTEILEGEGGLFRYAEKTTYAPDVPVHRIR